MKIGYPCSNLTLGISASRTFRLASFTPERLIETVTTNLDALQQILVWNDAHDIRFFRISSTTVPFASHPVMTVDWQTHFASTLASIGDYIRAHDMRINAHPGQYVILNSPREDVIQRSIAELAYHAELMDLLGIDDSHKVQIHTGGVYDDKQSAVDSFVTSYATLPEPIRRRLAIENDERQFSLADNLRIYEATGVPLIFDIFHHELFNHGETIAQALDAVIPTWHRHGAAMIDYSSQNPEKQAGAHTLSVDLDRFKSALDQLEGRPVDVMLEIKDKEQSVLAVQDLINRRHAGYASNVVASGTSASVSE